MNSYYSKWKIFYNHNHKFIILGCKENIYIYFMPKNICGGIEEKFFGKTGWCHHDSADGYMTWCIGCFKWWLHVDIFDYRDTSL